VLVTYKDYKQFKSESTITYGDEVEKPKPERRRSSRGNGLLDSKLERRRNPPNEQSRRVEDVGEL